MILHHTRDHMDMVGETIRSILTTTALPAILDAMAHGEEEGYNHPLEIAARPLIEANRAAREDLSAYHRVVDLQAEQRLAAVNHTVAGAA